ncbi:hypothetical protein Tco_1237472 [Tanacetum coccineum]
MEKKEKPNEQREQKKTSPTKKAWSIHGELLTAIKRSTNKYSVLEMYEKEISELNEMQNRENVDKFISQNKIPTENAINEEEDDVFNDDSGMNMDDVLGVDKGLLGDC